MKRLGVTAPFAGYDLRESCDLARRAEEIGYTDVWTAEVSETDCFVAAAAVAMVTEEVSLGCAIAPVYTRPAPLLAMSAASVQQASKGRFHLGIGVSTPLIVEGWMGQSYTRPLERTEETIAVLRSAFAGDKIKVAGTTVTVDGFKLGVPVDPPVPIYIAALGPRMMKLAAAQADGVALFLATERGISLASEAAPGRDVMARLICCPNEPVDDVRQFCRWALAPYLAADGYNHFMARQGYAAEAARVKELWREGDRDGARTAIPNEMIDALVLLGDADACKQRLEVLRTAGLTRPILWFVSLQGRDGVASALEAMAP